MRATTRIVFDEGQPAADYVAPVSAIHRVSDVMGELLDSQFVARLDVAGYRRRAQEYVAALGAHVDIWEIGNEVNGEWLGSTTDVAGRSPLRTRSSPPAVDGQRSPSITARARMDRTTCSRGSTRTVVRDAVAGFFFHPIYEPAILARIVDGIVLTGYQFVPVGAL